MPVGRSPQPILRPWLPEAIDPWVRSRLTRRRRAPIPNRRARSRTASGATRRRDAPWPTSQLQAAAVGPESCRSSSASWPTSTTAWTSRGLRDHPPPTDHAGPRSAELRQGRHQPPRPDHPGRRPARRVSGWPRWSRPRKPASSSPRAPPPASDSSSTASRKSCSCPSTRSSPRPDVAAGADAE